MNIKSIFAMAFMATALVGTTFSFASCEDDEKPETPQGVTTKQGVTVDGKYNTILEVKAGDEKQSMSIASMKGQTVVVTPNGNNKTLTISGYDIEVPTSPVPYAFIIQAPYELKNVKPTTNPDGTVALSGDEEVTMKLRLVGLNKEKANVPFKEYKVKVTTKGTIKNGKLELTNSFRPAGMPMDVVYTYTGQK